jgi:beta-phosphoglucomutase
MANGVIFDMDGVLVDSGRPHQQSWQQVARKYGIDVSPEQFRDTFGRPSRDIIRIIWGDRLDDREIRTIDQEKELVYRELISARIPLMPGCRRLLERLHKAKIRIGVATSGPPENLELVLSDGLIANYFEAEVNGFEIGQGKPAPDCFLLAAERLQLPPAACVVVEDAPVGIEAARAAGMPAIGLVGTHPAARLQAAGAAATVDALSAISVELVLGLLK